MDKNVTWGKLLLTLIPAILGGIGFIISMSRTQDKQAVRIEYLEGNYKKLDDKLDKIGSEMTTIRILLENKANRP